MVFFIKQPGLSICVGMVPTGVDSPEFDEEESEQRGTVNPDTDWKRVYYYCTDHLGSSRLVLNSNGIITERLMSLFARTASTYTRRTQRSAFSILEM